MPTFVVWLHDQDLTQQILSLFRVSGKNRLLGYVSWCILFHALALCVDWTAAVICYELIIIHRRLNFIEATFLLLNLWKYIVVLETVVSNWWMHKSFLCRCSSEHVHRFSWILLVRSIWMLAVRVGILTLLQVYVLPCYLIFQNSFFALENWGYLLTTRSIRYLIPMWLHLINTVKLEFSLASHFILHFWSLIRVH